MTPLAAHALASETALMVGAPGVLFASVPVTGPLALGHDPEPEEETATTV